MKLFNLQNWYFNGAFCSPSMKTTEYESLVKFIYFSIPIDVCNIVWRQINFLTTRCKVENETIF